MTDGYIVLPHSIYKKDENGRILSEITFPEKEPGRYEIERTYVSEVLFGSGESEKLVEMAVRQIKDAGGSVSASCPFARKYLKEHPDLAR